MRFAMCIVLVCYFASTLTNAEIIFQRIEFKLSGRNLPPKKNPFAEEIPDQKARKPKKCRTETSKGNQNPDWNKRCSVDFENKNSKIFFDIRHDKKGKDESLGRVMIFAKNLLTVGQTISEEIWDEEKKYWAGTLLVTPTSTSVYRVASNITATN